MQVISFMNMKGGVGKTTLAVNVSYALAYVHKKNVLVVDSDPQFNATQYLLEDDQYLAHLSNEKKGTIRDIFVPRRPGRVNTVKGVAKPTNRAKMPLSDCTLSVFNPGQNRGRLDIIPSTLQLMDIETSSRGAETKLKTYLKEKASGYHYVIIDCPPTISIFTQAAILASDKYLVPIKPDPLSVLGLPLLERWLADYTDDAGIQVEQVGLVFSLVRGPTPKVMRDVMDELRRERTDTVFAEYLSVSTDVAKSVDAHEPIFLHRRHSKPAQQILNIAAEFVQRTT
jgi:chromosome partitioning protein